MSLYSWSIKESNCSLCWAGSSSASQAWTHWLKELKLNRKTRAQRENYLSQTKIQVSKKLQWRTSEASVYLVPMPWPLVPTRANRERKPSGTNHCNTIIDCLTNDGGLSFILKVRGQLQHLLSLHQNKHPGCHTEFTNISQKLTSSLYHNIISCNKLPVNTISII